MKIVNKSKDITISDNADIANSFFSRLRGLMFSQPRDLVLVSKGESIAYSSIHMIFMKFPIHVLWLDSRMRVVDIKKKILPFNIFLKRKTWKIYKPKKAAKYVIELGKGKLGTTEVGDEIGFIDDKY